MHLWKEEKHDVSHPEQRQHSNEMNNKVHHGTQRQKGYKM